MPSPVLDNPQLYSSTFSGIRVNSITYSVLDRVFADVAVNWLEFDEYIRSIIAAKLPVPTMRVHSVHPRDIYPDTETDVDIRKHIGYHGTLHRC